MSKINFPSEYVPFNNVWVCGNTFNRGKVILEVEGHAVFLIGKGDENSATKIWLNVPKTVAGKPKWSSVIDNGISQDDEFRIHSSKHGNEVSFKGVPILQYRVDNKTLLITLVNFAPIGLNIFGGLSSLVVSGNTLSNNTFENVETMVGIGG